MVAETVFYERDPIAPLARCSGLLIGDHDSLKKITIGVAGVRKDYQIVETHLVATDGGALTMLVKVRDPSRGLLRRPMSMRGDAAPLTALFVLAVLFAVGFVGYQFEAKPGMLPAALGWIAAEAFGGYALIWLVYVTLALQVQKAMGGSETVGSVIGIQFLAGMALLLSVYWWYLTRDLAAPHIFPGDHARYYEALKSRITASPLFELMVLPLLLVIVRLIGLSALGSAFKGLIGFLKK